MTDEEIVLYFNEHRLAKLESYLLKDGSSVEHELQNLLDRFYEQTVPEHERMEVEAQIELEREREAAQREASRRFAVVHFHEGDDDFFFTSELRNSFYSIAQPASNLKKIPFKCPPMQEQLKWQEQVHPLLGRYLNNRLENEKLSALRDALLPKLMSGELDVSNIQL